MDPLALIEDYLSYQENGMKNLITWFFNQAMLQEALQQAGAAQYERTDARKAHRNGYKDRTLKNRYGETVLRKPQFREFPFETRVFGRYARVGESSGERNRRILPPGSSDEKGPGDRQSSGDRPAFSGFGFPDGQGPRRPGSGIPPAADRTSYPVSLCGCFLLQNSGRNTVCYQSGPGGRRGAGRQLPEDPGCESHRL